MTTYVLADRTTTQKSPDASTNFALPPGSISINLNEGAYPPSSIGIQTIVTGTDPNGIGCTVEIIGCNDGVNWPNVSEGGGYSYSGSPPKLVNMEYLQWAGQFVSACVTSITGSNTRVKVTISG
jgi:hypothetical protein